MLYLRYLLILLTQVVLSKYEQEHGAHQFVEGGPITQLSNADFDEITQIGKTTQQVAWFIMFYAHWNQASVDMIPFWLKVAEKFKDQMKFGAIECHENEDIRDRLDIPLFPSFMYFTLDGQMHKFIGYRTMDNITSWIEKETWRTRVAEFTEIPETIHARSYMKRMLRRVFHPTALICYFFGFFIALGAFCYYDHRSHNKKMDYARRIKQELIRKRKEKEMKETEVHDFKTKIN